MRAMVLERISMIEDRPLKERDLNIPKPKFKEVLVAINACAICRTDLHIIEGEIPAGKMPLIPGHQIVGKVVDKGEGVKTYKIGDRIGIAWLNKTCGICPFCRRNEENLCDSPLFTGKDVDGGYAEYISVNEDFAYSIPDNYSDIEAAPLLCSGIIGWRALKLSAVNTGDILGLYGFGSSAHIILQVARYQGIRVYVFSRSLAHRKLAEELGADWTGDSGRNEPGSPPQKLNAAIIFAPAGNLIKEALKLLEKGGRVISAGIYLSPIPELDYTLIYGERVIKSVANATREDAREFLNFAEKFKIDIKTELFPLSQANESLKLLKEGKIIGTGVLVSKKLY